MRMTARTGFLTEDFAGRVLVICFPSFRVSPVLPTSVPFLKTCKFGSWLRFGVSLTPLFSYSLSANFTSACPPVAGQVGHSTVLGLARTLWALFREIKAAASRQKASDPTRFDKDKDTLFCGWASLLIYTHREQAQWVRPSASRKLRCSPAFKAGVESGDYFLVGLL